MPDFTALFAGPLAFNLHGLLNLGAGFFDIAVGAVMLANNPRSRLNRAFFFITFTGFIWVTCFGFISLTPSFDAAYAWLALSYFFGVPFIPAAIFYFSEACRRRPLQATLVKGAFAAATAFSLAMFFSPAMYCAIQNHPWGRYNVFRSTPLALAFFILLMMHFAVLLTLALNNFLRAGRETGGRIRRTQFRWITIAFGSGIL